MIDDFERCYAAVRSRDARFDGWFVVAVASTGVYCRPSCPAVTPKRRNVRFLAAAAAAHQQGFRACKRCRPDAAPGSPEWDVRADVVGRAMRLIAEGVVDREGVGGLASRLGYSARHVHRQLAAELGAGPLALARAERARTARVLIETTDLPFAHVAFASGFASVRQFNGTIREVFASSPTEMRQRGKAPSGTSDTLTLRLAFRRPADIGAVLRHLAARAVGGVEEAEGATAYRRSLRLPRGAGIVELAPADAHVRATLRLDDLRDLAAAVSRCRALLDLDADPVAIDRRLSEDPALAPLIAARPGLRVPGAADGVEMLVRAVLGQQVSIEAARTITARLVERRGTRLARPRGALTHLFPSPRALLDIDDGEIGVPRRRLAALRAVVRAVVDGGVEIDRGADRAAARRALTDIAGIGPWTAEYVALRALRDPDAFPVTDLVLRRAAERVGLPGHPAALLAHAQAWSPWRGYAAQHLWTSEIAGLPRAA